MALFNTGGYESFDRLRALLYPGTDIVLICFSVDNPCSAQSVINIWGPEIRSYCHRCPIILVACKKDLRTDPQTIAELNKQGKKPVTSHMGRQIATQIKANAYIECSSKTGEGVRDLLIRAARLSFRQRTHRTTNCQCILQ
jgi:Ras family protein A